MTDELLTTADVRRILGVGQNALTRYLPTIRHFRLGNPRTGPVRIRRSDLEAWMERRMTTPQEEKDGTEEVRHRQSPSAKQRPAVGRKAAGRKGRLSVLHGDGPGGRAPADGRGEAGAGSEDLVFPTRRASRA